MAVPADLMQALMAGGGGMPPGAEMAAGGPPPEALPPEAPPDGLYGANGGDNMEALKVALDALQQYAQEEDDDQHIQTVLKCVTALQGILAEEQKMADGLLGGKMDPRSLRRAQSSEGGQAY